MSSLMGPKSAASFRPKEKYLIFLVLATFCFVCFGAIFFLPNTDSKSDNISSQNMNRVYQVYKGLQDAGRDILLPAPPLASFDGQEGGHVPNHGHGQIDRPDPHKVEDRIKLLANIEMDEDLIRLREKQIKEQQKQVLPKPNIDNNNAVKQDHEKIKSKEGGRSSSEVVPADYEITKIKAQGDDKPPRIQGGQDHNSQAQKRRDTVKGMMQHAWDGYVKYAWGKNEVRPVSLRGHTASIFGQASMGATIVDSLDTLYIMGMMDEYEKAREWVESELDFNKMSGDVSVFETNIRYVGGLLSAYALTGDKMFLDKATHVADKLMPAFKSPTGIPFALINMRTGTAKNYGWASGGSSILSEFGTLHMEFAYLSDVTGDPSYKKAVEKVREAIQSAARPRNLYPNYLNPKTGKWGQQHTSMGALGDSFYEYLLKEWLRSGKTDNIAKEMFDQAATDVENELVKTSASGLTYFAEQKYGKLEHKMDHLACFGAGMYGLAAHEEKDQNSARWMEIAKGITNTCHESYDRSDTKLGPEAFRFSEAVEARAMKANERYYILRPETIESYFVMWRLTHDQKYRDWGWEAIQALETHCKAPGGYSGIKNVYQANVLKDDVQQSFFLAETLKYLYLLFSDDELISLDEWVFNTEAHPLPIMGHNKFYRSSNDIDTGAIKAKKSDILAASADAVLLH
jgi:mannosyl-oligosaccharide alpha-1,2-mannosidase